MNKSLIFIAATALTLPVAAQAQSNKSSGSTSGTTSGVFGGPLAEHQPQPKATPAVEGGGKKAVGDVTLSTDDKGKSSTTTFPAGTTTIYLQTKNVTGAKGDKVKVEWFNDSTKGKRFYQSGIELPNTLSYNPSFHVDNGGKAFAAGKYHVDVYVGTEKLRSAKFTVQ